MTESVEVNRSAAQVRHVLRLEGCRPTPLASYLKALGIFRLVAEQKDPSARGWWQNDVFHLESGLDGEGLTTFLLAEYEPTPILAPWNGGSGFYPKDNKEALEAIRDGHAARLRGLRGVIVDVEERIRRRGLEARPEPGDAKTAFVTELRSTADERFLRWIDAALTLGSDELLYPPLLGTGGNDGRLDFTNNFMTNLVSLFDSESGEPREGAREFLGSALFASPVADLPHSAIGQFAPGSAGGANAATGFTGGAIINRWDFVLTLEGSILLAASTVRRLGARGTAVLAYPFTVRPTGAGSGGAAPGDEEPARAESWMPLWGRRSTLAEVQRVLAEGRIVLNRRMPRDGLDVVRAIAKLGTDRGIVALQRYAYMRRSGLAYLATPLGRIRVRRNPDADIIDDLDRGEWLSRFRRMGRDKKSPARLRRLLHQLDDAIFDLAQASQSPDRAQPCVITLGRCQRYLAVSPRSREACPPVPVLGSGWALAADDGSPAFALAAGLAGLHGRDEASVKEGESRGGRPVLTTAEYMAPVATTHRGKGRRWDEHVTNRVVWSGGALDRKLGRMMTRRLLDQNALGLAELPLRGRCAVPLPVVASWLQHPEWDARIGALLEGLALVDRLSLSREREDVGAAPIPAAFTLLKPLFVPASRLKRALSGHSIGAENVVVPPPGQVVRFLNANQVDRAAQFASRSLRVRGLPGPLIPPRAGSLQGSRLLAALMVPLSDWDLGRALRSYFKTGGDRSDPTLLNQEG